MGITLDEQQKKAVTHAAGPLLVSAGPGSGKTRVITERVRHLTKSGAAPESILCLTFTEKAAGEMEERLNAAGLPDTKVCTFHSFAKEVLEDNFVESGVRRDARIFKRSSQLVWCIRNTDAFGLDPARITVGSNNASLYTEILDAIARFKEEMIAPDRLAGYLDERGAATASPETPGSAPPLRMLAELHKVYSRYQEYLTKKGLVDFGDIIMMAVALLQDNPGLRRTYQERFGHVLVDEFQDNNLAQFELAKLLGEHGSITAVGDDDQSIMRFQGAYPGIFEEFAAVYGGTQIHMGRNYRSTRNITDLAARLLAASPATATTKKSPESTHGTGDPVRVVAVPTPAHESGYIASRIKGMLGDEMARPDGTVRPTTYGDIAVLARRRADGQRIAAELEALGVPASFAGESSTSFTHAILDVISFLRVADSPSTSGAHLFRLLKRRGISEQNIVAITGTAYKRARHVPEGGQDFILETMRNYHRFGDATQKAEVAELLSQIDEAIGMSQNHTVPEIVYKAMTEFSGEYKRSAGAATHRDKKNLAMLNRLYEAAKEHHEIHPDGGLSDFIQYVSALEQVDVEIDEVRPGNAVNVMTVHKSKGKEFPVVFITDLTKRRFPGRYTARKFAVPQDLLRGRNRIAESKENHLEDERRLLYVGMTRAMHRLFLTYPKRRSEGSDNPEEPSEFLADLGYTDNPAVEYVDLEDEGEEGHRPAAYGPGGAAATAGPTQDLQREAAEAINGMCLRTAVHRIVQLSQADHFGRLGSLEGFEPLSVLDIDAEDVDLQAELERGGQALMEQQEQRRQGRTPSDDRQAPTLSASSIRAYETCPLSFKFQKVLMVPTPPGAALDLGSVIHRVIETMTRKKMEAAGAGAGAQITEADALAELERQWVFRSYQSRTEEDEAMRRARQMIRAYVTWENASRNTVVGTEIKFSVEIGRTAFAGRIDRLEKNPAGEYEVVDFKSSKRPLSSNKARADPQLNIYAKAVQDMHGRLPAKATLFYVGYDKMIEGGPTPEHLKKALIVYGITPESVEEALEPVVEAAQNIRGERFGPTPGVGACMFCHYRSICDFKVGSRR